VGGDDSEALHALVAAESSIRRMVLAAVCRRWPGPEAAAVVRMDRRWPDQTADVLRHPYLGEWAVRCLEGLLDAGGVRQRLLEIAVALALRTGTDFETGLPENADAVHVPSFGLLSLPPLPEPVRLVVRGGVLLWGAGGGAPQTVTEGSCGGPSWEPARRIVTDAFSVLLEDGDPYRKVTGAVPSPRLSDEECGRWRRVFAEAASRIRARHGRHLPGIRALLTACTPLVDTAQEGLVIAAPRAFGALGLSLPDTSARLGDLIVDGVQELKFNGLADLFDLAKSPQAQARLRSAYLDRSAYLGRSVAVPLNPGTRDWDDLTEDGRRMAAGLRV
jgi:uncharacterized protein